MAKTIRLTIDTERYRKPSREDIKAAKEYILRREDYARTLGGMIDDILEQAAERIVIICYMHDADPKSLLFSTAFNEDMMKEIAEVMNGIEDEILDLIYEYSTAASEDRNIINGLILWMSTLGRGNKNLNDTLEGYLYKTLQDWNAAIAAMKYSGLNEMEAVTRIKAYMHDIYSMPEMRNAFAKSGEFAATYIRSKGVQHGAVGISNNGSTNVVNMAKTTLQMAWMRSKVMEFMEEEEDEDGETYAENQAERNETERNKVAGVYVVRGSNFNCPICDDACKFYPLEEALGVLPVHPHCQCYMIPIYEK